MKNLVDQSDQNLPENLRSLLDAAFADNTRRAYRSDIESFTSWGGSLPSGPEEVSAYIADQAERLSVATIKRHLASLSHAHKVIGGAPNPILSPQVAATMRGLQRIHGKPQRAIEPLLISDLRSILDIMPSSNSGVRDACLLSVGFAGGLRRSELVALDVEDVLFEPSGMRLKINRSKVDQKGVGRTVGIPVGRSRYCVVQIAQGWIERLGRQTGPLFLAVPKSGHIGTNRLSPEAVANVVKRWVNRIGMDARCYSGHSLRAGFVTSAIQAGASEYSIRRQTGHASISSMERYIRIANVFEENACSSLF